MPFPLHITSGDYCGELLAKSGLPGEVFVWHDILYDGPRKPGWMDRPTLEARARFLEETTGGGLSYESILSGALEAQYGKLRGLSPQDEVILWFDACLFDQSMLAHILVCLHELGILNVQLLCIDHCEGIEPYNGLGQMSPEQLAAEYAGRIPVSNEMYEFAEAVDRAFADQDTGLFEKLAGWENPPLPWVPAAVARWLEEQPGRDGLGRLERIALEAIRHGCRTPSEIFKEASLRDSHPVFWGDITLWAKINNLASRQPPLVHIEGPADKLPQWENDSLNLFRIYPASDEGL